MYTGSVTGIAPHDWPLAPAFSLSRGWSYFGSRLLQAMTPAWAVDSVAAKLTAANAGTAVWLLPSLLTVVVVGLAGVLLVLRRSGRISWPPASVGLVPGSRILAGALFGASVLVLLVPCGRHAEIRAIEFRYLAPLLPLLWVAVATVLLSSGRRLVDWGLAAILVAVFAVGVPGQHRPYRHSHEFMRAGLDWLKMTVPSETVILSNGGKVLLDEDLTRRVFHISDWNFRHALGRELREEAGFLRYLRRNGIRYVVLFGAADRRKAEYWGRPLIGLFLGRWWQPWLAYRDDHVQVYRIPPTGPPPAHTRGTGP